MILTYHLSITFYPSRVVDATSVIFSRVGNSESSTTTDSVAFKDFLRAILHNTPLCLGALVGFTLRCESFILKVNSIIILLQGHFYNSDGEGK